MIARTTTHINWSHFSVKILNLRSPMNCRRTTIRRGKKAAERKEEGDEDAEQSAFIIVKPLVYRRCSPYPTPVTYALVFVSLRSFKKITNSRSSLLECLKLLGVAWQSLAIVTRWLDSKLIDSFYDNQWRMRAFVTLGFVSLGNYYFLLTTVNEEIAFFFFFFYPATSKK